MGNNQGWKRRVFFDWRFVKTEHRRSYRLAFILFWSILMYFLVQRYVVSAGVVTDISMLPTLLEGNYYLVNKYIYVFGLPERGDLVVLRRDQFASEQYVKRVIGLPGERLLIRSGVVYINGRRLEEPYAPDPTFPDLGPLTIEEESYFVMGDNRPVSEDSRHYGTVPGSHIQGKIRPDRLFPVR
ncbi:MAG: signal peptidase I [Candidatus Methylomirabilales bacterium]